MARKERPVAVIAPSMRSIKLYADGRIDYQGKSGSVIGATARVITTAAAQGAIRLERAGHLRDDSTYTAVTTAIISCYLVDKDLAPPVR